MKQETARLSGETARLSRELNEIRNSTAEARLRAESASASATEARDIALGRMGFREEQQRAIEFAFDSAELDGAARAALDAVAREIQARPELLVDIYGFTDAVGPDQYNLQLGQRRAEAAMRYLVDLTPGELRRYAAVSYGETKAAPAEYGLEGRAEDRRAVISLIARVPLGGSEAGTETPSEPEEGKTTPETITTSRADRPTPWQDVVGDS